MQAVYAQNLVPNHSFEQYDTCPYQGSQLHFVKHWFSPTQGTPDYYNACSITMNVPNTTGGVEAQDGDAYIGIHAITLWETEYLAVKLNEPLIANTEYCVSFYTTITKGGGLFCSIEKIGVYLSQDSISQSGYWYLHFLPQVRNTKPVIDTNWVWVSGNYKAKGGEQYIYIGNFDSINNLQNCNFNDPTQEATILLIDNVSVVEASECDLLSGIQLPNVITPNSDGINDFIDLFVGTEIKTSIYNRWGNLISEHSGNNVFWDGTTRGNKCTEGVYYMVIQYEMNGKQMMKQTYIHLFN